MNLYVNLCPPYTQRSDTVTVDVPAEHMEQFMQYVHMSCILHDSTYACMLHTAGMHVLPCLSMIARACMHLAWIARMHKAWMHVHACIHTGRHPKSEIRVRGVTEQLMCSMRGYVRWVKHS